MRARTISVKRMTKRELEIGRMLYPETDYEKALGVRPSVRGVVMNPVDHPHGGGEAKAGQGNPHPVTPWGVPTKGYKTRKNKRTQQFIVRDRRS